MEHAIAILFLLSGIQPAFVVDPAYPPNALAGGAVIATVSINQGSVSEVTIVSGNEPFAESVMAALKGWRFSPDIAHARVPVVIYFQNPSLMSSAAQEIDVPRGSRRDGTLAYPAKVVEPVYPANAVGQGSAVMRLEIDPSGKVTAVDPLKESGDLARSFANAARKWRFLPAEDDKGHPVPSEALAVCVYRFPVLAAPPRAPR